MASCDVSILHGKHIPPATPWLDRHLPCFRRALEAAIACGSGQVQQGHSPSPILVRHDPLAGMVAGGVTAHWLRQAKPAKSQAFSPT